MSDLHSHSMNITKLRTSCDFHSYHEPIAESFSQKLRVIVERPFYEPVGPLVGHLYRITSGKILALREGQTLPNEIP